MLGGSLPPSASAWLSSSFWRILVVVVVGFAVFVRGFFVAFRRLFVVFFFVIVFFVGVGILFGRFLLGGVLLAPFGGVEVVPQLPAIQSSTSHSSFSWKRAARPGLRPCAFSSTVQADGAGFRKGVDLASSSAFPHPCAMVMAGLPLRTGLRPGKAGSVIPGRRVRGGNDGPRPGSTCPNVAADPKGRLRLEFVCDRVHPDEPAFSGRPQNGEPRLSRSLVSLDPAAWANGTGLSGRRHVTPIVAVDGALRIGCAAKPRNRGSIVRNR